ncbi:MAG TPA: hypothetical protein PLU71_02370 [Candidatus Dependentiae bacterium]|nr:hypothetical protein [Candidatus Dependentiae bacterium]HRQ62676.1 hypothetical protein [Candidatus Dependentiae bacterium]
MAIGKTYVDELTTTLVKLGFFSKTEGDAIKQNFSDSDQAIFDSFLLEQGLIERDDLLRALSIHYQVPSFDVVGYFFESALLHQLPKDFLLRNAIIPLEVDENMLIMIASEPDLSDLVVRINEFVSYDIQFYVGIQEDITDAVKEFYDKAPTQEIPEDEDLREERLALRQEREEELEDIDNLSDDYYE